MPRRTSVGLGLALVLLGALYSRARPDDPPAAGQEPAAEPQAKGGPPQGQPSGNPFGGLDFVKGLKETPGCLGVETARTSSAKNVIFAWFKDKESVVAWYDSEMHQKAMFRFMNGPSEREPLAEVPDGTGPILVVASLTFSARPSVSGVRLPISQIAIELYTPLPGGAAMGGRFAPDSVKVPGLRDYTPEDEPKAGAPAGSPKD